MFYYSQVPSLNEIETNCSDLWWGHSVLFQSYKRSILSFPWARRGATWLTLLAVGGSMALLIPARTYSRETGTDSKLLYPFCHHVPLPASLGRFKTFLNSRVAKLWNMTWSDVNYHIQDTRWEAINLLIDKGNDTTPPPLFLRKGNKEGQLASNNGIIPSESSP